MWDRGGEGNRDTISLDSLTAAIPRVSGFFQRPRGFRPPPRLRSRLALSLAEREEISRGVVACRAGSIPPLGTHRISCLFR